MMLRVATAFSGGSIKPIKGFEDEYYVSKDGEIFSIPRNGLAGRDGTTNPNYKEWYAIKPCGDVFSGKNITLKEFCEKHKIHISTIIRNMKNDTAISNRNKNLCGWRFYHV